jgi:DNA-binding transcriptional MerR regulator
MAEMRIGELARRAGVTVPTIRFYERKRLLRRPPRTAAGQRIYDQRDLEIVATIRKAQRFGFVLREIRRMLALYAVPEEPTGKSPYRRGSAECLREIAEMGRKKLAELDGRIGELTGIRRELAETLEQVSRRLKPRRAAARRPHARRSASG